MGETDDLVAISQEGRAYIAAPAPTISNEAKPRPYVHMGGSEGSSGNARAAAPGWLAALYEYEEVFLETVKVFLLVFGSFAGAGVFTAKGAV